MHHYIIVNVINERILKFLYLTSVNIDNFFNSFIYLL